MMVLKRVKLNTALLSLLLGAIVLTSFYAISQKEGFFLDEIYTFRLSNKQYATFDKVCQALKEEGFDSYKQHFWEGDCNRIYDAETFKKDLYISDHGAFNYTNVVATQTMDVHPPLYYFIVHTVSSITKSSDLVMIGFFINLAFLLMTCLVIYRISCLLFSHKYKALLPVLFFGFSYAFMNSVTYFRMYCLLSFLITLLVYLYLKLQENGWRLENRSLLWICVVEFLAMYTQFFSLFFLLPIFLFALYAISSDVAALKKFVIGHVVTGVAFLLVWPQIFVQIMEGADQKDEAATLSFFRGLVGYVGMMDNALFDGWRVGVVLFAALVLLLLFQKIRARREELKSWIASCPKSKLMLLLFPSFLFYLGVAKFSPWVDFRYISPIFPILSIVVVTLIWKALSQWIRKERVANISMFAITLLLSVGWVKHVPLEHLYPMTEEKQQFLSNYGDLDAVVFDHAQPSIFIDVPMNYAHPKYINTDELHMMKEGFLEKMLVNDRYVLYLSHFCDIKNVGPILNQLHYSYESISYETQFHNLYLLKRIQPLD